MAGSESTPLILLLGILPVAGVIGTLLRIFCCSRLNRMDEEDARNGRQNRNNPNREENRRGNISRNNPNKNILNRDEHKRENRMRMREARNQNNISGSAGNRNNQEPTQPVLTASRPIRPEPIRPAQSTLTPSRIIPSAPPLSVPMITDVETRSPRDITNRNLQNKSPNPPPPSYRDLFPSNSSSDS